MSVSIGYLNRVSMDVSERVSRVVINESEEAEVLSVTANENKTVLKIGGIDHLNSITSITVYDDLDNILSRKVTNILVSSMQLVELEMEWEVTNK
ncbi:hypothetical protein PJK55_00535 [Exiguobacterium sp. MMG028]|uniref:hypothetical protein n=1 Tax=unclassified Exiguobacterium TaxID=2644629 RepID=UPI0004DF45F5|nr:MULTISPECIES: hypothetical protein [unclassified Exiguobacterium]MDA5559202.1 hypothetical protein [Exiguobacterium sp. MMG028]